MDELKTVNILVIWRGKKLNVEINSGATLNEFAHKLQHLTNVKSDTMRLLIPRSSDKSSKLLAPFSDNHSSFSLKESSILEGKPIRMMGVFEDEIKEVSQNGKADLRIAGFDEEERRLRQRMLNRPKNLLKVPQGTYIFCDFRTLYLPGIELNPPASEALKRMHMLAADPGIVAIMNKHRWRVGIMTEMAPVGYVGISPKCILGLNKNHGEEISLRLRTDDLKGFRKYESIKKTLLHELAHMVYSEHDADFYALDKQLNQEAASLDWTKSRSHTLSGHRHPDDYIEELCEETTVSSSQKLGGKRIDEMSTPRSTSVTAAYHRLFGASTGIMKDNKVDFEPDPDDFGYKVLVEPDPDDSVTKGEFPKDIDSNLKYEPDHDDDMEDQNNFEDHKLEAIDIEELHTGFHLTETFSVTHPDGCEKAKCMPNLTMDKRFFGSKTHAEPDPDDFEASRTMLKNRSDEPDPDDYIANENLDDEIQQNRVSQEPRAADAKMQNSMSACRNFGAPDPADMLIDLREDLNTENKIHEEPDPDDSDLKQASRKCANIVGPNPIDTLPIRSMQHCSQAIDYGEDSTKVCKMRGGPESDASCMEKGTWRCGNIVQNGHDDPVSRNLQDEADPDEIDESIVEPSNSNGVHDPNDQELQRIQDPVSAICIRLEDTIKMLKSEVNSVEATSVLQTLIKIIRNVIEHPNEIKFRKLRKANPQFQRNVGNHKAAMEVLFLVGFNEETVSDELGNSETYIVLKRNDPGLLWLAKSSLEMCMAL